LRSTPLVAAASRTGLRCFTVIDERAAGFFALGRARVSGAPIALLCTSGSAGCHYYPAVVEAAAARVPLVVLTADRPAELHGCGAPQTIDQTRLFGDHVRVAIELGCAHDSELAMRAVQRKATQAVAAALGPLPGPVHINAPARKPLEPDDDAPRPVRHTPRLFAPVARASDAAIAELAAVCRRGRRGVIIAGPAPVAFAADRAAVTALGAATGYPILAEATSQLRLVADTGACDGFAPLLGSAAFCAEHRPDVILQLGNPPAGWELSRYMADSTMADRYIIADHGWPDPHSDAAGLVLGDVRDTVDRLTEALAGTARDDAWTAGFATGSTLAWRCVEAELGRDGGTLGEDQAMRAVVGALPDGCLLALANSLPVRSVDWFCPRPGATVRVTHQRGANGIDGTIAGAVGAASAQDGPTALILGDVSFAHDAGALALARGVNTPLAIVVIDNGGGRIFDYLPIAGRTELAEDYRRHWLTPPGLEPTAIATGFGLATARVDSVGQLRDAVDTALATAGCTIIHATVEPTSGKQTKQRIIAALDRQWSKS